MQSSNYVFFFIASQVAVVQLAHMELIYPISEEFGSKLLSLNMITPLPGIIQLIEWNGQMVFQLINALS